MTRKLERTEAGSWGGAPLCFLLNILQIAAGMMVWKFKSDQVIPLLTAFLKLSVSLE